MLITFYKGYQIQIRPALDTKLSKLPLSCNTSSADDVIHKLSNTYCVL